MKIAVTYENGQVFQHFGQTQNFRLYNVENNTVMSAETISTNGNGHGALVGFLKNAGVDTVICGGIGGGAKSALESSGITLFGGVSGSADDAVKNYINGKLNFNPEVECSHHSHEHHGESHTCGQHGCH